MARFAPLFWAVPPTLAALMLARAALQPAATPLDAPRAVPAIVEHFDPPGRLHAPNSARPVTEAARPGSLKIQPASTHDSLELLQPGNDIGPISDDEAHRLETLEAPRHDYVPAPPLDRAATAPRPEQPQKEIVYPITETSELPLMADAWPGTSCVGESSQRLPVDLGPAASAISASTRPAGGKSPRPNEQALAAVRQQVSMMNQKAIKLAHRGALYSARAELLEAIRLTAQAQDAQDPSSQRVAALASALAALEEAEDFSPPAAARQARVPLEEIIRPHQTPVLKRTDATRLSSLAASQHYLAYAQQQLTLAAGIDPASAHSLYLLGKVHSYLSKESAAVQSAHTARAIVFHQAALGINPHHYQAANELGVLLARFGELASAKQMLLTSVTSHATASAWHNLAVVHEGLGESDLAGKARYEAQLLSEKSPQPASGQTVQWVDAATFAAQSPAEAADPPSAKTARAANAVPTNPRASAVRR